jgi:hypothetical protein
MEGPSSAHAKRRTAGEQRTHTITRERQRRTHLKILHPVLLIIISYMVTQTVLLITAGSIDKLKAFFPGSLFVIIALTIILLWTGDLVIDYKRRKHDVR